MKTSRFEQMSSGLPDGAVAPRQPLSSRRSAIESVECPKCKKRSVVKRSPNLFNCLNCNFHKELPPVSPFGTFASLYRQGDLRQTHRTQHDFSQNRLSHNNLIRSSDPNRIPGGGLEEMPTSEKLQPLVCAAIAVIFGIVFL